MWIDQNTGFRQDVPHRLIYPILDAGNTNLQIITESKVVKVLFDEQKRATGVQYLPAGADTPSTIKASKLVVLAGGALSTPQILQRSGIGDSALLSKFSIPVISDISAVGQTYQDHNVIFYPYHSTASAEETLDSILSGRLNLEAALKLKKASPGRHVLGWNGLDCVGKIRPTDDDAETFPSELKAYWERDYKPRPTRPLMLMSSIAGFAGDHSKVAVGQHFSLGPYTPYPYSRCSVRITGPSVSDPADFDCGFLSNAADVQKLVWGYKKQREIARRMAHYRRPLEVGHPRFATNSKASFEAVDAASKKEGRYVPVIYEKEDDEAIEKFVRENVSTAWHPLGTCPMKKREEGGVADKELNIYGFEGLKIVGKFDPFKVNEGIGEDGSDVGRSVDLS
jgi:alcohol oxidase